MFKVGDRVQLRNNLTLDDFVLLCVSQIYPYYLQNKSNYYIVNYIRETYLNITIDGSYLSFKKVHFRTSRKVKLERLLR